MKSVNLLHKWGFGDSDTNSTVGPNNPGFIMRETLINGCFDLAFVDKEVQRPARV